MFTLPLLKTGTKQDNIHLKKEQIRYMMPAEFNISRNSRPAECPAKIHMDRVGWLCQKEDGHDRSRGGPENEK